MKQSRMNATNHSSIETFAISCWVNIAFDVRYLPLSADDVWTNCILLWLTCHDLDNEIITITKHEK